MLELAILGLLKEEPLHGYELRKRLRDYLGLFASVSFGSLYPALARLEASGAVRAVEIHRSSTGYPMTGSLSGERTAFRRSRADTNRRSRSRRVYTITEQGQQRFDDLLSATPSQTDDERSFALRWTFARHLRPQARIRLLERHRAQLHQRLEKVSTAAESNGDLDPYSMSLVEHATESTRQDISWLNRLIDAEQRAARAASNLPDRAHDLQGKRTVTPPLRPRNAR